MDPQKRNADIAGSLFTSLHRHVKIEGVELPPADTTGTGSVRFTLAFARAAFASSFALQLPARRQQRLGLHLAFLSVHHRHRQGNNTKKLVH